MIETEIDNSQRIAIHRCTGKLLMEDVFISAQRLFANPGFERDYEVVWDLRDSEIAITLEEIINLASAIVQHANEARPSGKTAWVAPSAFADSIIRLLYDQHEWSTEWRTFSTMDAAIAWCKRDRPGQPANA